MRRDGLGRRLCDDSGCHKLFPCARHAREIVGGVLKDFNELSDKERGRIAKELDHVARFEYEGAACDECGVIKCGCPVEVRVERLLKAKPPRVGDDDDFFAPSWTPWNPGTWS